MAKIEYKKPEVIDSPVTFVPFCGWYKCSGCGVNEHFIPAQCPVCARLVSNYEQGQTDKLRAAMLERREEEYD